MELNSTRKSNAGSKQNALQLDAQVATVLLENIMCEQKLGDIARRYIDEWARTARKHLSPISIRQIRYIC